MKKPNRWQLLYLRNKYARIERRYSRKRHRQRQLRLARKGVRSYASKTVIVVAPDHFALEQARPRRHLLSFIERIEHILQHGGNVQIDFQNTSLLWPSGTLYFMAKIECLLDQYALRITCTYPKNVVVEQLFQHIGLLQRLGNSARKAITADNVRHWHYLSGTSVDLSAVTGLFDAWASTLGAEARAGLFEGLSEAITNVIHHAYQSSASRRPECEMRWWMFAQTKEKELSVAICDLGIGIPRSLSQKPELADILPRIIANLRRRPHTGLIEIAVESTRSRTKLPHRGKGLPDMLKFAREGEVGGFVICSEAGAFSYNAKSQGESGGDFARPISGTLIQWHLPLST